LKVIRIYFIGIFVLVGAIFANLFAAKIQLKSWYDLLQGIAKEFSLWNQLEIKDALWLFLFYPFFLGLSAYLGNFIHQKIF